MPALGPLYPTADGTQGSLGFSTGTTAWSLINSDPDTAPTTASWVEGLYNSAACELWMVLQDTPTDFESMDSVEIRVYIQSSGSLSNDTVQVQVGITTADLTETFLAGASSTTAQQAANWTGGTFTGQVYVVNCTYVNTTAAKSAWDAGYLHISWTKSKAGGWDSGTLQVAAIEVNGVYTAASQDFSGSGSISHTHSTSATGVKNAKGAGSVSHTQATAATYTGPAYDGSGSISQTHSVTATGRKNAYTSAAGVTSGYYDFDGTSTAYVQTPDHPSFDVTDLDVRVCVALDDYTPAANQWVLSRFYTSGDRSWAGPAITTTGLVQFAFSSDGSTTTYVTTPGANPIGTETGISDGEHVWLRVTMDVDNGSSQYQVRIYWSTDPITTDPASVSWTEWTGTLSNGTGAATSIHAGSNPIEVGRFSSSNPGINGRVYKAQVRNRIDSEFYEDFTGTNGDSWPADWNTVADTANGEVIDIQGNQGRMVIHYQASPASVGGPQARVESLPQQIDFDITGTIDWSSSTDDGTVFLRSSGLLNVNNDFPYGNCYGVTLGKDSNQVILWTLVGGQSSLGSDSGVFTGITKAAWRFQAIGSALKVKVWEAGTAEPFAWNIEATDVEYVEQGWFGLGSWSNSGGTADAIYWDDIRFNTGQPVLDADFTVNDQSGGSAAPWVFGSSGVTYSGDYYDFDGSDTARLTTPATADINADDDLEIIFRARFDGTSANTKAYNIVSQWSTVNADRHWLLTKNTNADNRLRFFYLRESDSTVQALQSNDNLIAWNSWRWYRFTLDLTNGSNRVATWYYSDEDQATPDGLTWQTNLADTGAPIDLATANGNAALDIGHYGGSTGQAMDGGISYVAVYRGLTQSVTSAFLDAALTDARGNVWIPGTAAIWTAPSVGNAVEITHTHSTSATGTSVNNDRSGSGSISQTHSATAAGTKKASGAGTVSHTSSTSATGQKNAAGAGSVTHTQATAATGNALEVRSGSGSISQTSATSAAGQKGGEGAGTVAHTQAATAAGVKGGEGAGSISQTSSTAATGSRPSQDFSGSGSISHTHSTSAAGVKGAAGAAAIAVRHVASAAPMRDGVFEALDSWSGDDTVVGAATVADAVAPGSGVGSYAVFFTGMSLFALDIPNKSLLDASLKDHRGWRVAILARLVSDNPGDWTKGWSLSPDFGGNRIGQDYPVSNGSNDDLWQWFVFTENDNVANDPTIYANDIYFALWNETGSPSANTRWHIAEVHIHRPRYSATAETTLTHPSSATATGKRAGAGSISHTAATTAAGRKDTAGAASITQTHSTTAVGTGPNVDKSGSGSISHGHTTSATGVKGGAGAATITSISVTSGVNLGDNRLEPLQDLYATNWVGAATPEDAVAPGSGVTSYAERDDGRGTALNTFLDGIPYLQTLSDLRPLDFRIQLLWRWLPRNASPVETNYSQSWETPSYYLGYTYDDVPTHGAWHWKEFSTRTNTGGSPAQEGRLIYWSLVQTPLELDYYWQIAEVRIYVGRYDEGVITHTHTTAATGTRSGTASVSHSHTTAATGQKNTAGAGSVSHGHTTTAAGFPLEHRSGSASISHSHSTAAAGIAAEDRVGSGSVSHTSSTAATGTKQVTGTGSISHSHTVTGTGASDQTKHAFGSGAIAHIATVAATGVKGSASTAAVAVTHTVEATGGRYAAATITATATATATGSRSYPGSVVVSSATAAAGVKGARGSASVAVAVAFGYDWAMYPRPVSTGAHKTTGENRGNRTRGSSGFGTTKPKSQPANDTR